ncbi:hypothetical protein [Phaeobacter gallaeciensis]|uniref:hypothetical protein n=1 Tax=Phaeobacter gallaeciensis TaxID=60890 RepID=UPI00237F9472|nr:hypothetical protein [Phaeobacter gallaeciensis]MDE4063806.1 hypothetical protein [Phaeobacter gallaeciensis]MDE4126840.1 hypothetical protein [Phaeobacter gallaeciensis]MDE4130695.1 hypothetical protein [Phaeobacter gallaeciensis]
MITKTAKFFIISILISHPIVQASAQAEALDVKIMSLRNSMESYADSITPRIKTLEEKISDLEEQELERRACFKASGEPQIYWPSHGSAKKNGCVRQSDLSKVTCSGQLVNGKNSCAECLVNGGMPYADPNSPGEFFCKFTGKKSCPPGFTAYAGWRSYASRTCSGGAYGTSCSVGGAPFNDYRYDNLPICVYQTCRDTNKGCISQTCYPSVNSIGCY